MPTRPQPSATPPEQVAERVPAAPAQPDDAAPAQPDPLAHPPLLRALARVQRMVAAGEPPEAIYPVVVDEAVGLVAADAGSLRLVDPAEPEWMVAVADHGCAGVGERWRRRAPLSEGVSGRVIRTGRPVFVDGASPAIRSSKLAPPGTAIAMGHPVLAAGGVIGCLVTASSAAGRDWSADERRVMAAFAEHVGPALNVARAGQAAAQATTDALTGLGSRVLLLESLRRRLGVDASDGLRSSTRARTVCVLFLDLDGFKLVNDSLGRPAGDRLLEAVAGRVRAATRRADVCARLGVDEFAVLLGDPASAETIAARLVQALGQPFAVDGHEVAVSVSVGIAEGSGEPEAILRDADLAMDQAKRGGGGRWDRFEPGLRAARLSRLDLRTQLRHAIEREELVLHYQPVFHIPTGRVIGFESLVRWKHRERGLVPPLEWIPLAEETGLIVDVDRWVLQTACAQLANWYRMVPLALSVNVSVCDLEQSDFPQTVAASLGDGFPASALVLEMTESISLHESPSVIAQLHAVKAHGVRLALDDFGTKYATLLSLAELPLDVLKIARPFLEFAGESRRNGRGLLGGILEAARLMGMRTIAEGIETEAQRALLTELGCDYGQGFLLGRPMPAPEAERLLSGEQARARP